MNAIEHYEAALAAAFPNGASGEVFEHWNAARSAQAVLSVPERLVPDMKFGKQHFYAQGWNDCIDVVLEGKEES